MTYGTRPLPNKHWNLVRTNVQNHKLKRRDRSDRRVPVNDNQRKWGQLQDMLKGQSANGTRNTKDNGVKWPNGGKTGSEGQQGRFDSGSEEEVLVMEQEQLHYAEPDLNKIFDDADNNYESKEKSLYEGDRPSNASHDDDSEKGGKGAEASANEDYDDDVDWQKKTETDKKYDWSKNRRRSNSVYDPEITKVRAEEIDQRKNKARSRDRDLHSLEYEPANEDLKRRSKRMTTSRKPELVNKDNEEVDEGGTIASGLNSEEEYNPGNSNSIEEGKDAAAEPEADGDEDHEVTGSNFKENDEEIEDENENRKEGKKKAKSLRLKNLTDTIKKCAPKFAEKLLDALEKQKSDCSIQFDDVCKQHKKKHDGPIFASYSCENGQTADSFKDSMKKKMRDLIGGVYTKACEGAGAIRDAAEEWQDEVTPQEDGSWSQIGGKGGIRCVPHYDNRIEDHTVYVCSCCFDEIIARNAYVNIKYFDAGFGCGKPKIVSRSFENRPYFCEKLLSSMHKKRRESFLRFYGKRHQMRGGVHCISVIPSMEKEYLAQQAKLESCNEEDINHFNEDSRDEN